MVRTMDSKKPSEYFSKVEIEGLVDHLCTKHWDIFFSDSKHLFLLDNWSVRQVVLCRVIMDSIHWIPTSPYFNSQVSSWFCKTNDRLICPYPLLNMVVFENCFTGLLLKFYFRPFDDIRSNRKWNLLSTVNRKSQPETLFLVGHWRLEGMRNDLTKSFRPYRLSISHNQYP